MFKRQKKIIVKIVEPDNTITRKKCSMTSGSVELEKGEKGRGKAAWNARFTGGCIIREKSGLGTKTYIQVKRDSDVATDWAKDPVTPATWDKPTAQRFYQAETIRHSGFNPKPSSSPVLYIVLALSAFTTFLLILPYIRG